MNLQGAAPIDPQMKAQHQKDLQRHDKPVTDSAVFQSVLHSVANAIVAPEEMQKQRLRRDKELRENGKGMKDDPDEEKDKIFQKVQKIKKTIKNLAKMERRNLGV